MSGSISLSELVRVVQETTVNSYKNSGDPHVQVGWRSTDSEQATRISWSPLVASVESSLLFILERGLGIVLQATRGSQNFPS